MDLTGISDETLVAIKKAQTAGVNSGTGIQGVDLSDLISLVPVVTPFRDMLARTTPDQGARNAEWRALVNVNSAQPSPFIAYDAAAALAQLDERDVFAPYVPLGMGYTVTEDAISLARGYADAKAIATFNSLNQWKIAEDKAAVGACSFALTAPAGITATTAATGGNIAASTAVNVVIAARTGANYFWGGNSKATAATITTGSSGGNNAATFAWPSVKGAVAYDVQVGGFYYTTVTVPTVTVTSVPTANAAVPNLPDLSTVVPTFSTAGDNGSAGANQFNGLYATLAGDYGSNSIVSPGSGTPSGAIWLDNAGGQLTVSGGGISQLDALNLDIYNQSRLSPSAFMVSSQEANSISSLVLNSPGAVTYLSMNDAVARGDVVAGGRVGVYVNRSVPGAEIPIEVHPHVTPGNIIARTDLVPYPNSNISRTLEIRCQRDVYQYVYGSDRASGGPREDGENRAVETFINRAPVAMGVIQGVAKS